MTTFQQGSQPGDGDSITGVTYRYIISSSDACPVG